LVLALAAQRGLESGDPGEQVKYILNIARHDPNPKYDAREARDRMNAAYNTYVEQPFFESQVLLMEITPEQFDAIRAAALEVAK
jgi:hypothetical protein